VFNPKDWDLVATDESPPRTKGVAEASFYAHRFRQLLRLFAPKAPLSKPFTPTDFPDGYSLVAECLAETNMQERINFTFF